MSSQYEIWLNTLNDVSIYIDTHKKRPLNGSKNNIEQQLANWINKQNNNFNNNTHSMKEEIYSNKWIQFKQKYYIYLRSPTELWFDTLNEVKIYINNNKIKPSHKSDDNNIRQLSGWLYSQRKNHNTNEHSMKKDNIKQAWELFMNEYQQYFVSDEDIWIKKLDEVKQFININKKKPLKNKLDDIEKQLYYWITNQNTNYKINTIDIKNKKIWEQFMTEYQQYFPNNPAIKNL
jgi:hypothetical protein